MVTNELRGERVDVVPFSDDPVELIQTRWPRPRPRGPPRRGDRHRHRHRERLPALPRHRQGGQNARLAARLTGWRIDIKSETQLAEEEAGGYGEQDWAEGEWIEDEKGELVWKPAEGGEAMSAEEWTHQAEDPTEAAAAEPGSAPPGPTPTTLTPTPRREPSSKTSSTRRCVESRRRRRSKRPSWRPR